MSWVSFDKLKTLCESIKLYVDDKIGDYVKKSGDTMTGNLKVATSANEETNIEISDYEIKHNLSGSTNEKIAFTSNAEVEFSNETTGNLTNILIAEPTANSHGATKKYVDDAIDAVDHSTFVKKSGDTMTGALNFEGSDGSVTVEAGGISINKSGEATGNIVVSLKEESGAYVPQFTLNNASGNPVTVKIADPTEDAEATTKNYVDTQNALDVKLADEMTDTELATLTALFA